MEQDDFLARKEQILNRNSAKNFKEFNIENELKKLPAKPGVYLMHDASDEIIYVGKAKQLRKRVASYFSGQHRHSPKTAAMLSVADVMVALWNGEASAGRAAPRGSTDPALGSGLAVPAQALPEAA